MSVAMLRLHGRSHTAQEHCAQLGLSSAMEDTSLENLCAGGFPGGLGACMVLGGGSIHGSVLLFALLEAARGARSRVVAGPDGTTRRVPPQARGMGRAQEPSLSCSQVLVQILLFLGLPGL